MTVRDRNILIHQTFPIPNAHGSVRAVENSTYDAFSPGDVRYVLPFSYNLRIISGFHIRQRCHNGFNESKQRSKCS